MNKKIPVLLVVWMAAAPLMAADSAFYFVALKDLKFEAGAPPTLPTQSHPPRRSSLRPVEAQPYAHLDGPGEIFLSYGDRAARRFPWNSTVRHVAVKAPSGGEVRGRLFWPKPDSKGTRIFPFRIPAAKASKSARDGFYQAMSEHYSALQRGSQPGSAWFRHRHMEANRERRGRERQDSQDSSDNRETREIDDTFDLFTGGRAISENLQLDRQLESAEEGKLSVRVGSLSGITVNAMDFRPLIKGRKPELDSLARFIPEDQHAVFFPSFASLTRMMDETRDRGVNLLFSFEPESQNDQIRQRYQTQLFLPLNKIARLLGPQIIGSVALTGSDPYVRTGSDLVVLFESSNPEVLLQTVRASQALAVQVDAAVRTVVETVHGVEALGVVSTDRRISSYVARWEDLVLVANSRTQLARVINVARGRAKSLGELDEYRFFRLKYPKTPTETAFVVVPDAAIRRWCGPRWRIGASRRTRAAAILSDLQARHMTALVRGTPASRQLDVDHGLPNKGEFHLLGDGVFSTAYGSTAFLTPIAELEIDKVSRAEANAYNRFRDQYQGRWRRFFDPIGIRLSTQGEELRGEVAVYPMIGGSEYRNLAMLATGSELTPSSGDPHPETLIHWALALNTKSDLFQRFSTFFAFATPSLRTNPLGWVGNSVAFYFDQGPFWKKLEHIDEIEPFFSEHSQDVPAAINLEVSNRLHLAAFLTALRGFASQSSADLLMWETRRHGDSSYVRISENPARRRSGANSFSVYYAITSRALVISMNETMIHRALDRDAAGVEASSGDVAAPAREWAGKHMGLRIDQNFMSAVRSFSRRPLLEKLQQQSWKNLPILNEWKTRFPDRDPLELHQSVWHSRLTCPGGGDYRWNEKWQTMESTVYGHPGSPRMPADLPAFFDRIESAEFGLTFEHEGVSAIGTLKRKPVQSRQ